MPELFGPLPRHSIADLPLIAAALAPLAAAAAAAAVGPWLDERPGPRAAAARAGVTSPSGLVAALGCALGGLVLALGLAGAAGAPSGLVVSPGWILARIGTIDAVFGFDLDVPRALVALVGCALGAAHAARRGGRDAGSAARTAALVAGAVTAAAADGAATAALGLGLVLAASAAGARPARWAAGATSLVLVVLAAGVMAFGLEGRWLQGARGGFLSDYQPRFIAVRDGPAPNVRPRGIAAAGGHGTLTMTSTPGAEVYTGVADESTLRARRAPLATAPFTAVQVPAVLHKIAVVPGGAAVVSGDGLEAALLDAVDVRSGDDVVVQPIGASVTWRDLDAQLALRDAEGHHPLRSAFAEKQLAGSTVPTAVLALLFLAAIAALADVPRRAARAAAAGGPAEVALVAGTLAVAAMTPAARVGGLVPLASAWPLLACVAAAAVGAIVAARRGSAALPGAASFLCGVAALVAVTADAGVVAPVIAALGGAAAFALARSAHGGGASASRPVPAGVSSAGASGRKKKGGS